MSPCRAGCPLPEGRDVAGAVDQTVYRLDHTPSTRRVSFRPRESCQSELIYFTQCATRLLNDREWQVLIWV